MGYRSRHTWRHFIIDFHTSPALKQGRLNPILSTSGRGRGKKSLSWPAAFNGMEGGRQGGGNILERQAVTLRCGLAPRPCSALLATAALKQT